MVWFSENIDARGRKSCGRSRNLCTEDVNVCRKVGSQIASLYAWLSSAARPRDRMHARMQPAARDRIHDTSNYSRKMPLCILRWQVLCQSACVRHCCLCEALLSFLNFALLPVWGIVRQQCLNGFTESIQNRHFTFASKYVIPDIVWSELKSLPFYWHERSCAIYRHDPSVTGRRFCASKIDERAISSNQTGSES